MAQNAVFKLKGSARSWLRAKWGDTTPTWVEFERHFKTEFFPTGNEINLQTQLSLMRKRKDESYQSLLHRIEALARKAYPGVTEMAICQYVRNSLAEDKIHVTLTRLNTLSELSEHLKTIDSTTTGYKEKTKNENSTKSKPKLDGTSKSEDDSSETRDTPEDDDSVKQEPKPKWKKDYSRMRCANCGNMGHSYHICKQTKNEETINKNLRKYRAEWANRKISIESPEEEDWTDWAQRQFAEEIESVPETDSGNYQLDVGLRQAQLRIGTTIMNGSLSNISGFNYFVNADPIIRVGINDFTTNALIDCGANCSMVDEKLISSIKDKIFPYDGPKITTISGEDITPTRGYKRLKVQMGNREFEINPVVTKNMSPMLLLGQDAMSAGEFSVNIKSRKVIDTKPIEMEEMGIQTSMESGLNSEDREIFRVQETEASLINKRIAVNMFQTNESITGTNTKNCEESEGVFEKPISNRTKSITREYLLFPL